MGLDVYRFIHPHYPPVSTILCHKYQQLAFYSSFLYEKRTAVELAQMITSEEIDELEAGSVIHKPK